MVNILKEIGIQQWRVRASEKDSVADQFGELEAIQTTNQEHTKIEQSVDLIPESLSSYQPNDQALHTTQPNEELKEQSSSVAGFPGSLKQALQDPQRAKSNEPIINSSIPTTASVKEKPSVGIVDNDSETPNQSDKKTLVPLNISELIGSSANAPEVYAEPDKFEVTADAVPHKYHDDGVDWLDLEQRIKTNEYCASCGWGNAFLGSGNQQADWLFVVDAPAARNIEAQSMFVGRAGQLFDALLAAVGVTRDQIYETSIFKCVPAGDLSVIPQCDSIIGQQVKLVAPKVIITFGEFASQTAIKSNLSLKDLRLNDYCFMDSTVPVIPTYSPAQMLDDNSLKALVWQDLKKSLKVFSV